jgi:hypothetical protein
VTLVDPRAQDPAQTLHYRQHRRATWQLLRVHHADVLADARTRGVDELLARKAAAASIRGETRSWMSELLTRATLPALAEMFAGGASWGLGGEHLVDHTDAVARVIDHCYPLPTWTELRPLAPTPALDVVSWSHWVHTWREEFGAALHEAPAPARSSASPPWAPWLAGAAILGTAAILVAAKRE